MKRICLICVTACLLLGAAPSSAELYRWVDERGQIHYSDRPAHSQPHEIGVRPPTSAGQAPDQRMDKTRRLLNAYEVERQQQREQRAKQKQQAEERRRNCLQARDNLRQYSESGSVYRLDDEGKRLYLSEQERAALVARHRQAAAEWCD